MHHPLFLDNLLHREFLIFEISDASGVVLHKDAKWFQAFQNFKENNQYVNSELRRLN